MTQNFLEKYYVSNLKFHLIMSLKGGRTLLLFSNGRYKGCRAVGKDENQSTASDGEKLTTANLLVQVLITP